MNRAEGAAREISRLDMLARRDQRVNRIHPLVKFLLTVGYIAAVVSFPKYDVFGLLGMMVYPIATFLLGELSVRDAFRRLRVVLPLVCVAGLFNPLLDQNRVRLGDVWISAGVLSMLTLMGKGVFSLLASYLLIATTTAEALCGALSMLRLPEAVITQFLLTFRYITVLLEEVGRMTQAYALRAPRQKGVHRKVWGPFAGQLLLRSMDRANEVYESMLLRGFSGKRFYQRQRTPLCGRDLAYGAFWLALFALFRFFPVLLLVGGIFL